MLTVADTALTLQSSKIILRAIVERFNLLPNAVAGFFTLPIERGHSWSLPSVFGRLLQIAETRYGPRDRDYTVLGIEFGQQTPRIWFPGDRKDIIIQLGKSALLDPARAVFQLAHETIHILAPVIPPAAVVEEGLAVLFSNEVGAFQAPPFTTGEANYQDAGRLVAALLALDPAAILNIRSRMPSFSDWTPELIKDVVPTVGSSFASELCSKFKY